MNRIAAVFKRFRRANDWRSEDRKRGVDLKRHFFWCAFRTLWFNGITGDYAEFGCWGCKTFPLAYEQIKRRDQNAHLWAFDSFRGLPKPDKDAGDDHPVWQKGQMAISSDRFHHLCVKRGIPRHAYTTVEGYFNQTLPPLGRDKPPTDICLAYVDCDLYSSTIDVFNFLMPRLKHGMILALDDYHCWSSDELAGERRAMLQYFTHHPKWVLTPFMRISWAGESFVVENRAMVEQASAAGRPEGL